MRNHTSHHLISIDNEANDVNCSEMLENFVLQQGDCGAKLLSVLERYIQYCNFKVSPLNLEDRQEILQEVAIKILNKHHQLRDNCKGWLFTIIRNEYITRIRSTNRYAQVFEPDSNGNLVSVDQSSHLTLLNVDSNLFDETECLEYVFNHIESQPTGAMDINIYTHCALGLSHSEIAKETGRTTGAIGKRISLLRGQVKQLMQELC